MKIYRDHLHDDEAYVEERKENLEMGMDYFDLAYFYIRKNKQKQAIDIMEEGITKGMGNLSKLFNYLANYYARREDLSNLKRIVNLSLKKKSSEVAVLNVLFDLYMKNSEYDKAVETMLKSIDYIGRSGYVEQYKKIRANFKGENLKLIERKLLETARKKNLREYLDICLENVGSIYRLLEETGIMEVKRFKEKEVLV